jgi:hypothetical protein
MKAIPDSAKDHISNARYYLEAANKLPPPTKDAAHILLLLISWENIVIADKELSAWATDKAIDPKIRKDHETKFKDAPEILRVIVGAPGAHTPARKIRFSSGKELTDLRLACQYGSTTESKAVREIFKTGWHADDFRRQLEAKIKWVEMLHEIYLKL